MMLPGEGGVEPLNVTPFTTEFALSAGPITAAAVAVKVTERAPAVATICTVPGLLGKVNTVLAVPSALVVSVRLRSDPPPLTMAKRTKTPGRGAPDAVATETTSGGTFVPTAPVALFPLI